MDKVLPVDSFMEINGGLVWLVDDDEIDYADNVKKSYRGDIYPSEPPILSAGERKSIKSPEMGYYTKDGKFDYLFKSRPNTIDNFEWYKILRRRRMTQ
jgi:hypothetical protein